MVVHGSAPVAVSGHWCATVSATRPASPPATQWGPQTVTQTVWRIGSDDTAHSAEILRGTDPARPLTRWAEEISRGDAHRVCAGYLFSEVNRDTVEVLTRNGCEVVTHPEQHCCGSLHAHN